MRNFICNELEPFAYLIYMVAVFLRYNHTKLARHKVLFLFYGAAVLLLMVGLIITSVLNSWSYNVLFLANICVFAFYFSSMLSSRRKQTAVWVCCALNVIMLVYFDIKGNFFSDFNGYAYGVSFITIVLYALFYFYELLVNVKEENILLNFDFWLVCGYLLYFLGSFFIVIYYEHVEVSERANVWGIQNGILFICSLTMLWAHARIAKQQIQANE